eukprot:TRINITY_DN54481_c0_g1_i1.p1 TRINITY_DN54481_c0_g1~~TRINITY_DN54481_c0_g1_i1.p1  ORF type:complete len:282 (-),score=26.36 TRINITY_DN54481_c0_g1_i1:70-915(-)
MVDDLTLPQFPGQLHQRRVATEPPTRKEQKKEQKGLDESSPVDRSTHSKITPQSLLARLFGALCSACSRRHSPAKSSEPDMPKRDGLIRVDECGDSKHRLLHVSGYDQGGGFLFLICEWVAKQGINIKKADIVTEFGIVTNSIEVCAKSEVAILAMVKKLPELERKLTTPTASDTELSSQLEDLSARFSLQPDTLRVEHFKLTLLVPGPPKELRYCLKMTGIDRPGLLAYVALILCRCDFHIVRAKIGSIEDKSTNMFELATNSTDAAIRLSKHFVLGVEG